MGSSRGLGLSSKDLGIPFHKRKSPRRGVGPGCGVGPPGLESPFCHWWALCEHGWICTCFSLSPSRLVCKQRKLSSMISMIAGIFCDSEHCSRPANLEPESPFMRLRRLSQCPELGKAGPLMTMLQTTCSFLWPYSWTTWSQFSTLFMPLDPLFPFPVASGFPCSLAADLFHTLVISSSCPSCGLVYED